MKKLVFSRFWVIFPSELPTLTYFWWRQFRSWTQEVINLFLSQKIKRCLPFCHKTTKFEDKERRNKCLSRFSDRMSENELKSCNCIWFCTLLLYFGTLTCFRLTKGLATFFRPETIVASFLHLMVLFFKCYQTILQNASFWCCIND